MTQTSLAQPEATLPTQEALLAPEIGTRLVNPVLCQLEAKYGEQVVKQACLEAGVPREYLLDINNWVSALFHRRFTESLWRHVSGDAPLPPRDDPFWLPWRIAGHDGFTPERLGPYWALFRTIATPSAFFRAFTKFASRFNQTIEGRLIAQGIGWSVVEVGPAPGLSAEFDVPGNCWTRLGALEGLPTLWDLPLARVKHTSCMYDSESPAPACVYHVSYGVLRGEHRRWALPLGALVLGMIVATAMGWLAHSALAIGSLLVAMDIRRRLRNEELDRSAAEGLDQLLRQADARYTHLWEKGQELRRAYLANRKLSGYLPSPLVEDILRNPEMELKLGGQRCYGAVLFVDIVSYTPRCQRQSPEQVVRDLNLYFSFIDGVIAQHSGVIDKRMGDGVMVVFTPRDSEAPLDALMRGVRCGLGMLAVVPACNAALAAIGSDPLQVRLGLAAGPLVQGNMGSPAHVEYTVIGEPVNLAARLESHAQSGCLLMPTEQFQLLDLGPLRTHEQVLQVKGVAEPVSVTEIIP